MHGFSLTQTFSQYDYFLSVLTAIWIKFFPVETLALLGRLSFFALFFGLYLFAKNFYQNKQLAVYLLISVIIIKVYGNTYPPDFCFQVTPLRLDWWIVLLVLAFWKGPSHWLVGVLPWVSYYFSS